MNKYISLEKRIFTHKCNYLQTYRHTHSHIYRVYIIENISDKRD